MEEAASDTPGTEQTTEKKGFFASIFGKKNKDVTGDIPIVPAKHYIAVKRIVTPGILIDGVLEITTGLKPDEEFIVKGQTLLNDGARVNVIERVSPLSSER
jgi:multidrug efflux pump subunit AcrA (membrane-fusion protein)